MRKGRGRGREGRIVQVEDEASNQDNEGGNVGNLTVDQLAQLIRTTVNEALRNNRSPTPPTSLPPSSTPPPPPPPHGQLETIWEEIRRIERHVGDWSIPLDRENPFSVDILNEDLPANFRQPSIKDYEGSTDPEEHLGRFNNAALLHRYSDGVKCWVFLTTLVRSAQKWFDLLEPRSIQSLRQFIIVFVNQYATSKRYLKTSLGLFNIKQHDAESLREFIIRFNGAALEVPTATTDTLVNAFTQGLRGGEFIKSLVKIPPRSYDKLLSRAEKYVNLDEAQKQRRIDGRVGEREKGKEKIDVGRKRPAERGLDHSQSRGSFSYARLAMSLERAMEICEEKKKLERPKQDEKSPRLPLSDKFCGFHQEYGHTTNDCQRLEEEVQRIMHRDPQIRDLLTRSSERYQADKRPR